VTGRSATLRSSAAGVDARFEEIRTKLSDPSLRVAIVHDWLFGMRGGEQCLEVFCELFPRAAVFTLFHEPGAVSKTIEERIKGVSCLQRLPFVGRYYRHLFPFYSLGVRDIDRQLAKGSYDLVISISHCVAKNIRVPADTFHLCYCLTPVRYLWDKYDDYFAGKLLEPLIRLVATKLRKKDLVGAKGVHRFVAISEFVRQRIYRCYGVNSDVVYPPVRAEWITPRVESVEGSGFLVVNALVPYKNTMAIVEAFNQSGLPLTIVGSGPEAEKLRARAQSNIKFLSSVSDEQLAELYRSSLALVFAAEEDFGMTPVESLAAGRPVICLGQGGALETVPQNSLRPVGIYFNAPTPESINQAVEQFLHRQDEFSVDNCTAQSEQFSYARFAEALYSVVEDCGVLIRTKGKC
jgi:glycosyltransferase involved in cell wall biosynthesis